MLGVRLRLPQAALGSGESKILINAPASVDPTVCCHPGRAGRFPLCCETALEYRPIMPDIVALFCLPDGSTCGVMRSDLAIHQ